MSATTTSKRNDDAETEAEGAAPPPRRSKLLIIVAAGLLLLAGQGGGAWFLLGASAEAEATVVAEPAPPPPPPPQFLKLDPIQFQVRRQNGSFMLVTLRADLDLAGDAGADAPYHMPRLRDALLVALSRPVMPTRVEDDRPPLDEIKQRMMVASRAVLGADAVRAVLIQGIYISVKLAVAIAVAALLLGGAWPLAAVAAEHAAAPDAKAAGDAKAAPPANAPVYLPLGRFQVPVFDGDSLAGQLVLEATLHVADEAAKKEYEPRLDRAREAMLADLYDIAQLMAWSGKPFALEQIKARLGATVARALGGAKGTEFLVQNYSYTAI